MKDIVFDLGGVMIDWNPRHLYKKIFASEEEMEWFLSTVCTPQWNTQQDAGRSFAKGLALVKEKLKIDDALDAFGCHGIGGIWGGIATGLFGQSSINSVARWDGLVYGDVRLFAAQLAGILVTIAVAIVGTLICVAIVKLFTPLRVTVREEQTGLDISQHGENAYPSFNGLDQ